MAAAEQVTPTRCARLRAMNSPNKPLNPATRTVCAPAAWSYYAYVGLTAQGRAHR
jgi:hypothetical protein